MNLQKLTRSAKLLASIHLGLALTKRKHGRYVTTVRFPEGDLQVLKNVISDEIGYLDIRYVTAVSINIGIRVEFIHDSKPLLSVVLMNVHNKYLNALESN